ncbi:RM36 protein, partial [Polyodon spathula]|nr:RM36 protein [Polyodon spathula]
MASLLLKHMVNSFSRQLSHLGRYTANHSSFATMMYRCMAMVQPRIVPSAFRMYRPSDAPLLGQCQHPCLQQSAGMKTKTALKRRCQDCCFVHRRGKLFVFCKTNPRHKQRQG